LLSVIYGGKDTFIAPSGHRYRTPVRAGRWVQRSSADKVMATSTSPTSSFGWQTDSRASRRSTSARDVNYFAFGQVTPT
jgi:hypothetical protein